MLFGHTPSQHPLSVPASFQSDGMPTSPTTDPPGSVTPPGNTGPNDGGRRGGGQLDAGRPLSQRNPSIDMPGGVLCDPNDTFLQTNFFGASILDFSTTLGYGEQSSSLTVKLVEDFCEGNPRIYYQGHADLRRNSFSTLRPVSTTEPDWFSPPWPGSPVYFRMGKFEFSGLLQSWTKSETTAGRPVYTVNIQDPRELLAGTSLIIGEDVTTPSIANIFNVFAVMEQFGGACAVSPVGGFGGAGVNGEGMPWNKILMGLHYLQATENYISFKDADFILDLSDLPVVPDDYRIGGSTVTLADAINKLCEDAGHDTFVDLVPTPLPSGRVINILKVRAVDRTQQQNTDTIKTFVETSSNLVMQNSRGRELRNEITNAMLIGGSKQDIYECECPPVIGKEKKGKKASEWLQGIIPFWGVKREDSHEIILTRQKKSPITGEDVLSIWAPFARVQEQLEKPLDEADLGTDPIDGETLVYDLDTDEMRAALSGRQDWQFWVQCDPNHPITKKYFPGGLAGAGPVGLANQFAAGINAIVGVGGGVIPPEVIRDINKVWGDFAGAKIDTTQEQRDMDKLYKFVVQYANRYGKEWLVPLYGNLCWKIDSDDPYKKKYSVEPTETGWPESSGSELIGLPLPIARVLFGDETGKVGSCMRWQLRDDKGAFAVGGFGGGFAMGNKLDFSSLNPDEYYISPAAGYAWLKTGIDKQLYFLKENRKATDYGPHVLLKIGSSIKSLPKPGAGGGVNPGLLALEKVFNVALNNAGIPAAAARAALEKMMNTPGSRILNFGMENATFPPQAGAVPLLNNILNYGPWESSPPGVDGKTVTEVVDGLVPWEYGGFDLMNTAGQNLANARVTYMQHGEMGSVQVPGLPNNVRVGFELNDIGGSKALIATDRSVSTAALVGEGTLDGSDENYYYLAAGSLDGTGGPNITAINVTVGAGGVTTQYDFRTYTPQYGKFSKFNAERLKRMGRARINTERERIRLSSTALSRRSRLMSAGLIAGAANRLIQPMAPAASPHHFLCGVLNQGWRSPNLGGQNLSRPTIVSETSAELETEHDKDNNSRYAEKAIMELGGLVRPVSMDGDGGLPAYYDTLSSNCVNSRNLSQRPMPPINGYGSPGGLAAGNYHVNINYLNPFTNPKDKPRNDKHVETDHVEHGHDINMIGRNAEPTKGSFAIDWQLWNQGETKDEVAYADDYRMFALRGPLLIHGWGYDLQGKPIPNAADEGMDEYTSAGVFQKTNLKDYFLPNFLRKSHTWPVAPVDLRFDRNRGVWTVPPPPRFVLLEMTVAVAPYGTTSQALIIDTTVPTSYDADGTAVSVGFVQFKDDIGVGHKKGAKVRAYYDDLDCVYKSFALAPEDDCNGLVLATMKEFMDAGEDGTATLTVGGAEVAVVNVLKQPILKDCKVILWKRCETTCSTLGDCPEGAANCVDNVCVDDDGNPMETPESVVYHVVQAEFRPLCVITSIGIDEQYPDPPLSNANVFAASLAGTAVRVAVAVFPDWYCHHERHGCPGFGGSDPTPPEGSCYVMYTRETGEECILGTFDGSLKNSECLQKLKGDFQNHSSFDSLNDWLYEDASLDAGWISTVNGILSSMSTTATIEKGCYGGGGRESVSFNLKYSANPTGSAMNHCSFGDMGARPNDVCWEDFWNELYNLFIADGCDVIDAVLELWVEGDSANCWDYDLTGGHQLREITESRVNQTNSLMGYDALTITPAPGGQGSSGGGGGGPVIEGPPAFTCADCVISVDEASICEGGQTYTQTTIPAGVISTCPAIGEEDENSEFYHEHYLGSFVLTAVADAELAAGAAVAVSVDYPEYPVLHINICERKIYLQTAWGEALCSDERGTAEESDQAGLNSWGLNVPVYMEPQHPQPANDDDPAPMAGELEMTTCYMVETGLDDTPCPEPPEDGWPDTGCECGDGDSSGDDDDDDDE